MAITKLKDTCLCAIVRDEKVNPAGGILDYIESTVPYVESAVIVDTGSIDGTREILEEAQGKYPHLVVADKVFAGFADARNYSLEFGKKEGTKYSIVLDADERLTPKDFSELDRFVGVSQGEVYRFEFQHIDSFGQETTSPSWCRRMFLLGNGPSFSGGIYEAFHIALSLSSIDVPVKIKHFLSSRFGKDAKSKWYQSLREQLDSHVMATPIGGLQPATYAGFSLWKEPNPHREKFR